MTAHLWAETFDRDLTAADLFAVQDEITEQVVAMVAQPYGVISRSAMSAAKAKRPESLSAYECVLRYWAYEELLTPAEHLRMRGCLEAAVQPSRNTLKRGHFSPRSIGTKSCFSSTLVPSHRPR